MFLNWACDGRLPPSCADPHSELAREYGLLVGAVPVMSVSSITPLAVAQLVNLRAVHASKGMTDSLIATLKTELTPARCGTTGSRPSVFQDPIAHRQLEPHRLGLE